MTTVGFIVCMFLIVSCTIYGISITSFDGSIIRYYHNKIRYKNNYNRLYIGALYHKFDRFDGHVVCEIIDIFKKYNCEYVKIKYTSNNKEEEFPIEHFLSSDYVRHGNSYVPNFEFLK